MVFETAYRKLFENMSVFSVVVYECLCFLRYKCEYVCVCVSSFVGIEQVGDLKIDFLPLKYQ